MPTRRELLNKVVLKVGDVEVPVVVDRHAARRLQIRYDPRPDHDLPRRVGNDNGRRSGNARSGRTADACDVEFGQKVVSLLAAAERQLAQRRR